MKINEVILICEEAVESSWIKDLSYKNGNVILTTNAGKVYKIHTVPENVYNTWLLDDSIGSFFKKQIEHKYVIT